MGFKVGIDIEQVKRFKDKPFEENEAFYNRVFTKSELEYCLKKTDPYMHFAGKFAAKEAVIKAVNSIKRLAILTDIEIQNGSDGSPKVNLSGAAGIDNCDINLSISHTKDTAVAVAIAVNIR